MTLRSKIIKLAHNHPELRQHLVPILRRAADDSFEEAIKGKKFKNPETQKDHHAGQDTKSSSAPEKKSRSSIKSC